MHRYNVDMEWLKWKDLYARIHTKRSKECRTVGRDVQLGRTTTDAKRTTRRKTGSVGTKDSKQPNGKQRSKSTGRVQRPTKKQSEKGLGKG